MFFTTYEFSYLVILFLDLKSIMGISETCKEIHELFINLPLYQDIYKIKPYLYRYNVSRRRRMRNKNKNIITKCFELGLLNLIKYLDKNGCDELIFVTDFYVTSYKAVSAATNGHINVLNWIKKNCPTTLEFADSQLNLLIKGAVTNGHVEVFKWLHQNNHKIKKSGVIYYAIVNNHINILEWYYKNGFNHKKYHNYDIIDAIIKYGHVDIFN